MAEQRCCTKLNLNLSASRRELARLARLEAYHAQQGHRNDKLPDMIRSAKAAVERAKKVIEEHEAERCVDVVDTTSASDREQMAAHSIQVGARA